MTRLAIGQFEISPGRPDLNARSMLNQINLAQKKDADIIVFPEMAIPGYLLGDTWEQPSFLRDCESWGQEIATASQNICVLFGNVGVDWNRKGDDGRVRKYNAFFIAHQGRFHGADNFPYPFRIKTLQPNYREFDDDRHFYSLRKLAPELGSTVDNLIRPVELDLNGNRIRLGCILCEDGWNDDYNVNPVNLLCRQGPLDLLVNLSCSPFTLGKNNKRHRIFGQQAKQHGVPLLYVNNVGIQNNGKTVYTFDGCSTVYDHLGRTRLHCEPFTEELALFDLDTLHQEPLSPVPVPPDDTDISSIYSCLTYGIKKFTSQIGLDRVVIGVSGGIDSAVAAALYADVLGPSQVLLVNMPSRFNSKTTIGISERLASSLGCNYHSIPIEESVALTSGQLESVGLPLSPFMKENVQARDRSSRILAATAAAFHGGFTCNANKTEMTVGYCTLYGDEAGFLAALADLWKHQIYALGRYLTEKVYQRPVIPQEVFEIVPSAELSAEQAIDEGKGDPLVYPYHDKLFLAFVEKWDRATPETIAEWYLEGTLEQQISCEAGLIKGIFSSPAAFIQDLERWWSLYTGMGVAKRIQAPPVLAVSRRAFGFDHREAQNTVHYTVRYLRLKEQILASAGFKEVYHV